MVALVAHILYLALLVFLLLLWVRVIFDVVRSVVRGWRPRGVMLVVAEAVYLVTDPPLRLVRRYVQPVRLGPLALDLAMPLTMFVTMILMYIALALS